MPLLATALELAAGGAARALLSQAVSFPQVLVRSTLFVERARRRSCRRPQDRCATKSHHTFVGPADRPGAPGHAFDDPVWLFEPSTTGSADWIRRVLVRAQDGQSSPTTRVLPSGLKSQRGDAEI